MDMRSDSDKTETFASPPQETHAQGKGHEFLPAFNTPLLTILLVDDDGELTEVAKEVVANWGWPVRLVVAQNGSEGIRLAGLNRPVVIVTDLMMPDMDGFQMLKNLSEIPDLMVSRVVVVTGMDDQQIKDHGDIPAGVEILHKPTPYDRLKEIVLTSTMFMPSVCSQSVQ